MAYEGTPLAQEYAAQVVYGGVAAKGKLAVTIPEMYFAGTGVYTPKTRLGYHQPEEVGINPTLLHAIDTIVSEGLQKEAFPGCQVLVAKDGMVVYSKSFGYEDYQKKRKITDASVYDLASVSKATGTLLAVMKAYDDRLITLNSTISTYLPEFQGTNKSDLRIEELLYHQSGMPAVINFYQNAIDKDSYSGSLFSATATRTHTLRFDAQTYVQTGFKFLPNLVSNERKMGFTTEVARNFFVHDTFKDSILKDIKDAKLTTRGRYVYSCINFITLKMIVERQTRQSMDKLLYETFFNRLGAWHTTYNPLQKMDTMQIVPTENDGFIRRQLLRGYVHDEAAAFQGGVSGNAGLFSNANDLAKVLQLYVNHGSYGGETYLSEATCRLFTESKSPTIRRGLGFDKPDMGNLNNSPCGELAPGSVYGHTGYTGPCFWIDPDSKLVYIFLCNRVNPSRTNNKLSSLNIRTRIQDAIYSAIEK
jgi:CubicO group peptidase (beta-lactamase class C family)